MWCVFLIISRSFQHYEKKGCLSKLFYLKILFRSMRRAHLFYNLCFDPFSSFIRKVQFLNFTNFPRNKWYLRELFWIFFISNLFWWIRKAILFDNVWFGLFLGSIEKVQFLTFSNFPRKKGYLNDLFRKFFRLQKVF